MSDSPSPRQSTGLHHVALRSTNFERTLRFYCEGLGFTRKVAWTMGKDNATQAVMLDAGDGNYIEVFSNGTEDEPAEARYAHVCLRTDDLERSHAAALTAGATERIAPTQVDIADQISGESVPVRLSFVIGPDGEVIEFMQGAKL
ncbi:MAG: VOC family protein [Opitutales bacterium]